MREWIFGGLLAVAALCVVRGVSEFSEGAAWIAAGVLGGLWVWLMFGEVGP